MVRENHGCCGEWLGVGVGVQRKDFEAFLPKNGGILDLGGKHLECCSCGYNSLVSLSSLPSLFPLFSPPPSLFECSGLRRNPNQAGAPTHATAAREGREREGGGWRGYRSSLEGPRGRRGEADHVAPPPGVAGLAGLDAREPGKPVAPSPCGSAGRTLTARLGRAVLRSL